MQETLDQQSEKELKRQRLYQIQDLLALMQKNIALINSPTNSRTVHVINGDLFQLAVQYYGNADYWTVIAEANNLSDPRIEGSATLLIPPAPTSNSGGILSD